MDPWWNSGRPRQNQRHGGSGQSAERIAAQAFALESESPDGNGAPASSKPYALYRISYCINMLYDIIHYEIRLHGHGANETNFPDSDSSAPDCFIKPSMASSRPGQGMNDATTTVPRQLHRIPRNVSYHNDTIRYNTIRNAIHGSSAPVCFIEPSMALSRPSQGKNGGRLFLWIHGGTPDGQGVIGGMSPALPQNRSRPKPSHRG
jgi:hypothetical protein